MSLPNEIVLRPRFKIELDKSSSEALTFFENSKANQSHFLVSCIDEHVFLKLPVQERHFWSPQLHLEIIEASPKTSTLYGVFGPNPTIWTMFMFFHFIVAGLFLGFGIWTYSNWTLDNDFTLPLFLTLLMIVLWFVLYFVGRLGRASGKPQMRGLFEFMKETLSI